MNITGDRIRALREDADLSQSELAELTFTTRDVIAKIENGSRGISISLLNGMADYFHVSTDYLLGRANVAYPNQSIKDIAEKTGLAEESIRCLFLSNGTLPKYDKAVEDDDSNEYDEEMKVFLDFVIQNIEYSTLLREFSNLLSIYQSNTRFDGKDTKGSWIDIDSTLPNTVTMRSGEAVDYLFYTVSMEFISLIKKAMHEKYRFTRRKE